MTVLAQRWGLAVTASYTWRRNSSPKPDRKSTRLNSSHSQISYAVFCLKKKNIKLENTGEIIPNFQIAIVLSCYYLIHRHERYGGRKGEGDYENPSSPGKRLLATPRQTD